MRLKSELRSLQLHMHLADNRNRPVPGSPSLWWLHPFWIMAVPLLVMSFAAYLLPDADYRENWRTAKAFDSTAFALCVAVAAAFSIGCLLAAWINAGFLTNRQLVPGSSGARFGARELEILFGIAFAATIIGYAIWFGSILKQGGIGMITSMLAGGKAAADILKQSAGESIVTGVTTLTQFGMGTVLLGTYLGFTQGWRKVRSPLVLLLLATAVRATFLSERLSLIEVVLPSVILMLRLAGFGRPGSALRRLLLVAPLVGIVALYALFTFTEYFRSWSTSYADRGDQSLLEFSMVRLLGYYVTALNNGAITWHARGALYFPYETMDWLWRFPVLGHVLRDCLGGDPEIAATGKSIIAAEGNLEFNNGSGIFPVFSDLGIPAGLLYFMVLGCVAGLLHAAYRRGSATGLFLYSFLFVSLSEQVRILYMSQGRTLPTWVLLLLVVLLQRSRLLRAVRIPGRAVCAVPIPSQSLPPP